MSETQSAESKIEYALIECGTLHPASEWTEADGTVLWWAYFEAESRWVPIHVTSNGQLSVRFTHWSRIPAVELKEGK